jgi:hypothetical protein
MPILSSNEKRFGVLTSGGKYYKTFFDIIYTTSDVFSYDFD